MRTTPSWFLAVAVASGCAAPTVPVTVSAPKVWGDDQVVRTLAERYAEVRSLARGASARGFQELVDVRQDEATRIGAALDLTGQGEAQPVPAHEAGCSCPRCLALVLGTLRPQPIPSTAEQLQERIDQSDLVVSHELVALGDSTLADPRSRAVLLRFDVCFHGFVDLGSRRRFVIVAFVVRGRHGPTPRFEVYRLTPEMRSIFADERLRDRQADELDLQALGAWGGVGLTGGYSSRDQLEQRFEAALTTPLQFAIYRGRGGQDEGPFTFAFAFGPRRRLVERSAFSPTRWFGSELEIGYELQPGPRACEALLVFPDLDPSVPLDLAVSVFCDGTLVAEEDVDVARALGRPLDTFDVRCPGVVPPQATTRVVLVPLAGGDLLLDAGAGSFSAASRVFLGPQAVPAADAQLLGRGRLAVRVRPSAALAALLAQGTRSVVGVVLTPDQPDMRFDVDLVGGAR